VLEILAPLQIHNRSSQKLQYCLRLSGLSGQVEDLVLRFHLFRFLFFLSLVPLYWVARLVFKAPTFAIKIFKMISFFLAIIILCPEQETFGFIRVVLWAGPLALLSSALGFFGMRGLWFRLISLSILFPAIFNTKMGSIIWCLFAGVQFIGQRAQGLRNFVLSNVYICLLFAFSNYSIYIFFIFLSPVIELGAYLHNMNDFIGLISEDVIGLEAIVLDICQSGWFYHVVTIDEKWATRILEVLSAFLLLFFAKVPMRACGQG